ncbi:factor activating pos9 [Pichia californica]|uniref:Adenylate kinase isoenzyme 6 homolog n=1 Tax=Pichia californica TaxID=460514 RepID=A0A9P6WIF9_9ASCO|nr:factor activating pos9 [[Candida] californica]KAG0686363.1 factor activating pos9 [[Candida] californica]
MVSFRKLPNIIITGTPGCGKTSHAEEFVSQNPEFTHINVSEFAKKNDCIEGYDEDRDSSIVNEDRLLDILEPLSEKGGLVIDWHCCEIFPERWIDLVVVIRCDNTVLYNRLEARGYKQSKITENVECEIMQILLTEAMENYNSNIVVELNSESLDSLDENVSRISQWVEMWKENNPNGISNELD